jgi:hypothetical protein
MKIPRDCLGKVRGKSHPKILNRKVRKETPEPEAVVSFANFAEFFAYFAVSFLPPT